MKDVFKGLFTLLCVGLICVGLFLLCAAGATWIGSW